jgi:uracil-DNA glycosylase
MVETACRQRFLDRQLDLFPGAVVVALGSKATKRLRGRTFLSAFAAAPPGCNFRGARESWERIADAVRTGAITKE